ncbi:MAG: tetratricopeptide repeat protein [Candidatus Obscuribacterales bacterium]
MIRIGLILISLSLAVGFGTGIRKGRILSYCGPMVLIQDMSTIPLLAEYVELHPTDRDAVICQAFACNEAGRFAEAVEFWSRAIELDGEDHFGKPTPFLGRGSAFKSLGEIG